MRRPMIIRLVLILSVCILLTACGSKDNPSGKEARQASSVQYSNKPPKGWEQNPDSDFDYFYDSDLSLKI